MIDNFMKDVLRFLEKDGFFSYISLQLAKQRDVGMPFAARIEFNKKTNEFTVFYNPEKMEKLTPEQKYHIYKHELYHFIFEHLTGRRTNSTDKQEWLKDNICQDWAINGLDDMFTVMKDIQFVEMVKGEKVINEPMVPTVGVSKNVPRGQTYEWYLNNVDKSFFKQFAGYNLSDVCDLDLTDPAMKEFADQIAKDILRKSYDKANQHNTWGTVSHSIKDIIKKSLEPSMLTPEEVLKNFIISSITFGRKPYLMRRNRRNNDKIGRIKQKYGNFAIAIDESGSMGDDLLSRIYSFMETMSKYVSFDVIPFDADVDPVDVFRWEKGKHVSITRTKCGGTSFDPPTEFINGKKYDGAIFCTDLYGSLSVPCRYKRIWVAPKSSETYANVIGDKFGEKVLLLDK